MYKYILFDLDGTLTDPKEGICKSVQYALKHFDIDEPDLDKLEPFIGPPLVQSFTSFYHMSKEDADEAVIKYRERFGKVGLYENKIYDGIADLLDELHINGHLLAIASSKPTVFVKKILEHFRIDMYFDVVVGSELDGTRSTKEEVVEYALLSLYQKVDKNISSLKRCTSQKKDTVMIGDRCFDIEGAKAMSIDSIGVSYGYGGRDELEKAGASYVVDSVNDLRDFLTKDDTGNHQTKNDTKRTSEDSENIHTLKYSIFTIAPLGIYYLVGIITTFIGVTIIQRLVPPDVLVKQSTLYSGLIQAIYLSLTIIVLLNVYKKKHPLLLKTKAIQTAVCGFGILFAISVNLIFGYMDTVFHYSEKMVEEASLNSQLPIWLGTICFVFLAPICEEMIFRWIMFARIRRMLGSTAAVIITAIFFGLYHGNLLQGIYAFIMGIFIALVYEWTDSLLTPIIFHMSANAAVYYSRLLPMNIQNVLGSYIGCGIMLIFATILMVVIYKKTHNSNNS